MSLIDRIKKAWAEHLKSEEIKQTLEKQETLSYLAEHTVDEYFEFDADFDVTQFRGLIYCQLVTGIGADRKRKVVSCWTSPQNFLEHRGKFLKAIGRFEIEQSGFYRELKFKRVPLLKRLSVLSVVLAITTLLGAYGTFRSQFKEWFAQPEVIIYPINYEDKIDLPIGTRRAVRFAIKNASDWSPVTVQFGKPAVFGFDDKAADENDIKLTAVLNTNFPSLAIGETKEFTLPIEAWRKGEYWLILGTQTKAGDLVGRKHQQHRFQVSVWPNREFLPAQNIRPRNKKCLVDFPLISGVDDDKGIECEALLTNVPGVTFFGVAPFQDNPQSQDIQSLGNEVAMISWHTRKLTAMERSVTTLYLEANQDISPDKWTNIAQRIAFSFR